MRVSTFGQSKESEVIGPYRLARKPPVVDIVQPTAGSVVSAGAGGSPSGPGLFTRRRARDG